MSDNAREVYISVDGETDGPIPGPFSLVSFGAYATCYRTRDGFVSEPFPRTAKNTFYAELRPISERWEPDALAVSGLTREHLLANGREPGEVMTAFAAWVTAIAARPNVIRVIFAAYPLGFDWMFLYWYLISFSASGSPFSFSQHIDLKSYYAGLTGSLMSESSKAHMPAALLSQHPHTHNALDDAIEQGELLRNVLAWDGDRDFGKVEYGTE